MPKLIRFEELDSEDLQSRAAPLPSANTLSGFNYAKGYFGRLRLANGNIQLFNPEVILVKFIGHTHVSALRVEPMREWTAVKKLRKRADVQYAELDCLQRRQSMQAQWQPNDPQLNLQWHHEIVGSLKAWERTLGSHEVRLAIVDSAFQMDHPDLLANTVPGWDVANDQPVLASKGIDHSTLCAGMAAAVINNNTGVAGAGNCQVLPIVINGFISEMYNAVIWAADNGVRVVNISWDGANDPAMNEAGRYLKTKAAGMLVMSGVNQIGHLNYTNHPHVYCVSMTDTADNMWSADGDHIDFAAPGWEVYSTVTGSSYGWARGTSYAAALFSGVVAVLFSVNPALAPEQVEAILKKTAVDKGPAGRDPYFGWGRIDFGAAVIQAAATVSPPIEPVVISKSALTNGKFTVFAHYRAGLSYSLWRTDRLCPPAWQQVTNAQQSIENSTLSLADPAPENNTAFYCIGIEPPAKAN